MKICVYGAGAMGGFIGVLLARAGHDVSFVARGAHLAAMRSDGARLLIDGQELVERVRCTDDARELGHQDFVLITMKAHSVPAAVDSIVPLLGPDTAIVTGVNGIPYWYFHRQGSELDGITLESIDPGGRQMRLLGPERAIGCVLNPAADLVAPGVIRHVHGRKFPIGEPGGERTRRIEQLHQAMQDAGLEAPIRSDIRDEIWLKLWGNLSFNPISALTHATLVDLCQYPLTRELAAQMMMEAQAVANKLGIEFRVPLEKRIAGAEKVGKHKTSTLQDVEHGRGLELDALIGAVIELGKLTQTPTPHIEAVYALTKLLDKTLGEEHGRLRIEKLAGAA